VSETERVREQARRRKQKCAYINVFVINKSSKRRRRTAIVFVYNEDANIDEWFLSLNQKRERESKRPNEEKIRFCF
jgi:hypothetical protein